MYAILFSRKQTLFFPRANNRDVLLVFNARLLVFFLQKFQKGKERKKFSWNRFQFNDLKKHNRFKKRI